MARTLGEQTNAQLLESLEGADIIFCNLRTKRENEMTLWVLTYDQRATHHDYSNLYRLLNSWGAGHLQNSVWLAELNGGAENIRDTMRSHMHQDDTIAVVQLPVSGANWAAINCRPEGVNWLKSHYP